MVYSKHQCISRNMIRTMSQTLEKILPRPVRKCCQQSTNVGLYFITLTVHICVQGNRCEAVHQVGSYVGVKTCLVW